MRTLSVYYDSNEEIRNVDVSMTVQEATALVNLLGTMNGHAQKKLNIDSDMYDCLTRLFNGHYEDGAKNLHIDLKTLNEEKL